MDLVFDIESNGLLKDVSKIYSICATDTKSDKLYSYCPWSLEEAYEKLTEADNLIGYNIINYDIPVLNKLVPKFDYKGGLVDLAVMGRVIFGDGNDNLLKRIDYKLFKKGKLPGNLIGVHSLEAYGYRLGIFKGSYGKNDNAWDKWTPEMQDYCEQDVVVTKELLKHFVTKYMKPELWEPFYLEQRVNYILGVHQVQHPFSFDIEAAKEASQYAEKEIERIIQRMRTIRPNYYKPMYKKNELLINTPKRRSSLKAGDYIKLTYGTEPGAPYCPVVLNTFTGTDIDIIDLLHTVYKWKPKEFSEKTGQPLTGNDILELLNYDCIQDILDMKVLKKIQGYIKTGKNSWLKLVNDDGTINHRCNHIGTATHRGSHSSPNLGQIPSPRGSELKKNLGRKCRAMFAPPKGFYQIGSDLSGIEVRLLAHYLYPYDGGAYVDAVLNGDVHWLTVLYLGLVAEGTERDDSNPEHVDFRDAIAKTFLYAFIYGAGAEKLKKILKCKTVKEAKAKSKRFSDSISLDQLKEDIQEVCRTNGRFKAIDGRYIYCDTLHKALNYLLQSAGGIIAKRWMVICHDNLLKAGYTEDKVAQMIWVHDELQFQVREDLDPKPIMKIIEDSALEAGEYYNMRIPIEAQSKKGANWNECH